MGKGCDGESEGCIGIFHFRLEIHGHCRDIGNSGRISQGILCLPTYLKRDFEAGGFTFVYQNGPTYADVYGVTTRNEC